MNRTVQSRAKRAIDVTGASLGLAATAPVMAAAAAAIRATMGRPVLFRHTRPGLHGRPFELLKFRTMRPPRAGEGFEADGERLSRVGSLLRKTSVDELPALVNVLRGEMSLVGPRPLLMEYLDRYSPEQARRHDVKPGVTGYSAATVRNAADWDEKLAHDVWYVDHWSLWLDLRILARTAITVLRREGITHPGQATMPVFQGPGRKAA